MLGSSSITRIRLTGFLAGFLGGIVHLLLRCRQRNRDCRALPNPALKRNRAAVLLDDLSSVGHAESEPLRFSRIERLEDVFCLLLTNSWPSVGDFESKSFARLVYGDTQCAALRHGFNGIEYEIHQSPAHGRFIDHCGGWLLRQHETHLNFV